MDAQAPSIRLDTADLEALRAAFDEVLAPLGPARVFLFGSRTRPEARGGDIDLLVELDRTPPVPLLELARRLRLALFDRMEEQKIDIVWDVPGERSAFLPLAREQAVELWRTRS